MTKQIVFRAPRSMIDRRQPLLQSDDASSHGSMRRRLAEVAGGTTAECAAVCCCCPCGLATFVVLAVYRLPAGLCRKALMGRKRRRRRQLMIQQQQQQQGSNKSLSSLCGCDDMEMMKIQLPFANEFVHGGTNNNNSDDNDEGKNVIDDGVAELEKEMWDRFYSAGFWRSWSQRSETVAT